MKGTSHVKSKVFIATLLIVTGVFTACKKSDKEDIAKNLSENVTSDFATKSDAEFVADEDIPEKLTYTLSGAQGTFKVDADVYADGYGNVPTYNIKKCEKDDEWLEGYAKKFFDDGEYENVKPYMFCSFDELKQEKSFCEELLSQYEASAPAYEIIMKEKMDIESQIENYVEENYVKYPDKKLIYEFDTDLASQGGKVLNCERAHLKGEADGKLWYMNYERGIENEETALYDDSVGCLYGVCLENIPDIMYLTKIDIGFPNKCERETAEKEAEKLLESLGFKNMKQIYISQLRVDTDEDYMLDGYSITYGPSVNGIDLLYGTSAEKIIAEEQETGALSDNMAVQPFVKIEVFSGGIFGFCIFEQYEISNVLAENSSMLSFEQVDSQVKSVYQSLIEYNRIDIEINEVRFGYACITYDGISYAMVPVWRYYTIPNSGPGKFPIATVCALDGSFLFPGESIYNGDDFFWMD